MSQYPPNPNNNPYGQNPPDPNANQGTAYGGPPSGPGQYNPYANNPGTPGTNPNPYGPYSPNPTQPSTGPGSNPDYGSYNPYAPNPPTPAPATNPNYNPYDPYGQTVAGTSPNYGPYQAPVPPGPPPAPSQPPVQPRRGLSSRVIILAAVVLVLVIGGIAFGLISYNNTQQNNANANATATAQANSRATATAQAKAAASATAQAALTATAIASNFPFSANQVLNDPLTDNSKGNGWETNSDCKFQGNAYHVTDPQAHTFNFCSAINTNFQDFTFQVEGLLNSGDGIGISFRGNANTNQIYLFMLFTDGTYKLIAYVDPTGTNARTLTSGSLPTTATLGNTNAIAVVARGSNLSVYLNQSVVAMFSDPTYTHGQIGLAVDNNTGNAEAVFTNAQVWGLP